MSLFWIISQSLSSKLQKKQSQTKVLDKVIEFTKDGWPSKVKQELSNHFARRNKISVVRKLPNLE